MCSCTYRFTNKYIFVPDGAKTIAIAPIFDSSRIVVPHDLLWFSLQQAFASSGHLTLASPNKADLFLQAHVKNAVSAEYESDASSTLPDPNMFLDDTGKPFAPTDYVDLHAADNFSKRERLNFTVLIEVWDLRNKTLMLRKEYTLGSNFNMFSIQPTPPQESQYIRNEENAELLVASMAKDFAKNVVSDLFSTPYFSKKSPPPKLR